MDVMANVRHFKNLNAQKNLFYINDFHVGKDFLLDQNIQRMKQEVTSFITDIYLTYTIKSK